MNQPAIVVIAYDRPDALKRLLDSIENAVYPENTRPDLVISIDKSDSDAVVNVAQSFSYSHGGKVVLARKSRLGLRKHVLSCGELTKDYGSIIVLEDDLFVAPCFYEFACSALDFSQEDDRIGSISLYNHLFNVHKRESFCAIDDGYDNYYLQLASSWGQAYTKDQWISFRTWYDANENRNLAAPAVPANVSGWSEKSWLKYYIVYLIETGRYTLYPRIGMTTNFGDAGTHADKSDTDLQIPISGSRIHPYCNFSTTAQSRAVYDSFFEPVAFIRDGKIVFGLPQEASGTEDNEPLVTDLYGIKPVEKLLSGCSRVLSSQRLPYRIVKSFGRQMRPVDANIVYDVGGNDFYLYDMTERSQAPKSVPEALRFLYEYRGISAARMMKMIKYRISEKLGRS